MSCIPYRCAEWSLRATSVSYRRRHHLAFASDIKGTAFSRVQKCEVTMNKLKQIPISNWCKLCPVSESYKQWMKAVFFIPHVEYQNTNVGLHSLAVGYVQFGYVVFAALPKKLSATNTHYTECSHTLTTSYFQLYQLHCSNPQCKLLE